ncbi:MAG: hypothetical protein H6Q72_941 [Firmicutes bacterium]|nr:hypothetical protein [Bacillota bacterium]
MKCLFEKRYTPYEARMLAPAVGMVIVLLAVAVFLITGCAPEQPNQTETIKPRVDRRDWIKLNELRDSEGNTVCAYKIDGDLEWWDIIIVYDKNGIIKQVMSKQFRN